MSRDEVALAEAVAAQREAASGILTQSAGAAGVPLRALDYGGVAQAFRVRNKNAFTGEWRPDREAT